MTLTLERLCIDVLSRTRGLDLVEIGTFMPIGCFTILLEELIHNSLISVGAAFHVIQSLIEKDSRFISESLRVECEICRTHTYVSTKGQLEDYQCSNCYITTCSNCILICKDCNTRSCQECLMYLLHTMPTWSLWYTCAEEMTPPWTMEKHIKEETKYIYRKQIKKSNLPHVCFSCFVSQVNYETVKKRLYKVRQIYY